MVKRGVGTRITPVRIQGLRPSLRSPQREGLLVPPCTHPRGMMLLRKPPSPPRPRRVLIFLKSESESEVMTTMWVWTMNCARSATNSCGAALDTSGKRRQHNECHRRSQSLTKNGFLRAQSASRKQKAPVTSGGHQKEETL